MTKVREIKWPEEFNDLKRMEELMVCGICYDYMDTSVITPCSHNYCSLCIRKYLHYKTQCPACFHVFFEKDLYVNRTMDVFIQYFIQLREKLINLIQNRVIYNKVVEQDEKAPSTPPVRPARNTHCIKSPRKLEISLNEPEPSNIKSPFASTSKCDPSSPSSIRSPKVLPNIPKMFNTPKRRETTVAVVPTKSSANSVACPVCSVDISADHINLHLDACLKREVAQETCKEEKISAPKRSTLPKLVLRVMKDAELKKKMKEYGLSTQGDRRTLENRFTRYSTIYNAECDKLDPRPVADLIKQCEMEEKQERKLDSYFTVQMSESNRLQVERNAKEEKIEEAQKIYREAHKSSFEKLIEQVRKQRKEEIEKKRQNVEDSSSTREQSTSGNSENPSESAPESEENVYIPSAEIPFQDSDSDESCPLQHYTCDGPTKYISGNLNDSSPSTSAASSPVKRLQGIFVKSVDELNKVNNIEIPEKTSNNPYDVTTDEYSDEDIPSSPVLNRNPNRKRVKLSKKSLNTSTSFSSSISKENNSPVQKHGREAEARSLCNSIIQDFTFDGLSDDSSNEFENKLRPQDLKDSREAASISTLEVTDNLIQSKVNNESACDKKVPEEKANNAAVSNGLNALDDNFSFDILNGESSNECTDISTVNSKIIQKQVINETASYTNGTVPEKENDAHSANGNSPPSVNESPMRRPVRKRNRPARFSENQTAKQVKQKINGHIEDESQDSGSPDNLYKATTTDGSLKRRRGRSKVNSTNSPPSDKIQNPPKRPVRRRQVASSSLS